MKVRFNVVEEYLEELRSDPPPSNVVRLTIEHHYAPGQPFAAVYVSSSYVNDRRELVYLRQACGEMFGQYQDRATAESERVKGMVQAACKATGLEVRKGRYEEGSQ